MDEADVHQIRLDVARTRFPVLGSILGLGFEVFGSGFDALRFEDEKQKVQGLGL